MHAGDLKSYAKIILFIFYLPHPNLELRQNIGRHWRNIKSTTLSQF